MLAVAVLAVVVVAAAAAVGSHNSIRRNPLLRGLPPFFANLMLQSSHNYDIFIIGSGAAGLALALSLTDDANIAIISKDDLLAGSSQYAQGGIAAVLEQTTENINAHIQDTLETGAGLCDPKVAAFTVNHAKDAIQWLIDHGVQFTIDPQSQHFHLTQEGGHRQRRILHAADRTGAAIVKTLIEQVFAHSNIHCYSQHTAIDLIIEQGQCIGAYVLDNHTGNIDTFYAKKNRVSNGRCEQCLSTHDKSRLHLRRRHCNGMACWL